MSKTKFYRLRQKGTTMYVKFGTGLFASWSTQPLADSTRWESRDTAEKMLMSIAPQDRDSFMVSTHTS